MQTNTAVEQICLDGVSSVASLRRQRIFVQRITAAEKKGAPLLRNTDVGGLTANMSTRAVEWVFCVYWHPKLNPSNPGFRPRTNPGLRVWKRAGYPGFRVPGYPGCISYWLATWSRLEKAIIWLTVDLSQYDWRRRRYNDFSQHRRHVQRSQTP